MMLTLVLVWLLGLTSTVVLWLMARTADLQQENDDLQARLVDSEHRGAQLSFGNSQQAESLRRAGAILERMRSKLRKWRSYSRELEAISKHEARENGTNLATAAVYGELIDLHEDVRRIAHRLAARLASTEEVLRLEGCLGRIAEALKGLGR